MNTITKLLLLALLVCFSPVGAKAQEIEVGTGLICDTKEQIEQFVKFRDEGVGNDAAVEQVNATSPNACGVVPVAYIKGEKVGQIHTSEGVMDIYAIIVVAVHNGATFVPVQPPLPQATMFRTARKGVEI